MKRENLYSVLFEQQKDFQEERIFVDREIKNKVLSFLHLKLPIVITGVRRSGKSTLLYLLKNELKLSKKEFIYVNFNDERFVDFSLDDFQKILDFLIEQSYSVDCTLFLDEIQETTGWEKWIDRIKEKHPIFITGSNSKLLSKEISTVLTGRSINLSLYPFSFREFLAAKQISYQEWKLNLQLQSKIRQAFSEFLMLGGVPKVIVDNDKRLLQENYENILYRDIIKRFHQTLEKPIKETSLYLLSNISKEVSLRSVSKIVEVKNLATIKSVLQTFENSFLFFFVPKFNFSVKKQIQNPKKVYSVDNGFVHQLGFRFSENNGRMLENLVFLELKRRNYDLYYFSEKGECDFLIRQGAKIHTAIQVCYDLHEENKNREIKGLEEALQKFNAEEGLILTYDQESERIIHNKKVHILPVWKWLLE